MAKKKKDKAIGIDPDFQKELSESKPVEDKDIVKGEEGTYGHEVLKAPDLVQNILLSIHDALVDSVTLAEVNKDPVLVRAITSLRSARDRIKNDLKI